MGRATGGATWLSYYRSREVILPTSGPVTKLFDWEKRRADLQKLFAGAKPGLVYVTAFKDRASMVGYLNEISWETEVWVAASPTHMIHFNGERFLGPYDT